MIARVLLATTSAIVLIVTTTVSALAWSEPLQGDPDLTHERPVGYYLWHDENGMHLRTHGPGDEHHFTAYLHTDGVFVDVDSVRLESRDRFAVINGGHTLVLKFTTYNWTDGVNFRVDGGTKMRLNLRLDGELIDTRSIFLGVNGKHPDSNPFTLRR